MIYSVIKYMMLLIVQPVDCAVCFKTKYKLGDVFFLPPCS